MELMMESAAADRLWAVHQIQQLAYGYAHAFAVRDRELMVSLWDETESPVRLPSLDIHRIRRDIDRWWNTLVTVLLYVTNHLIEFDDDQRARGNVHCLGQIDLGHQYVDQTILYRDRYVRRDDRWLFETREHLLWFGQERERHPLRQPPARWPRRQIGLGVMLESEDRAEASVGGVA
jgi:SnoaL-like domain